MCSVLFIGERTWYYGHFNLFKHILGIETLGLSCVLVFTGFCFIQKT